MIVYGDHAGLVSPREAIRTLAELAAELRTATRSELARELLHRSGALAQGLLDWRFEQRGYDELDEPGRKATQLCLAAAQLFQADPEKRPRLVEAFEAALEALAADCPATPLRCRAPEGFLLYAVYPELYRAAARAAAIAGPVQVIGIRSIGCVLGAVVAAALESERLPWTVRPVGHPFRRELHVGARLGEALCTPPGLAYAVVDEGPGLSGSSFHAVSRWLVARGVPSDRIWLFPSHPHEPGARAAPEVRAAYRASRRGYVSFEAHFRPTEAGHENQLTGWFSDALPPRISAVEELSYGRWRAHLFSSEASYPACHVQQERRKYLVRCEAGPFLLRYLLQGMFAESVARRAQLLAQEGLIPPVLAVRHGFTLGPWLADARPIPCAAVERGAFVAAVARHLAFVARTFPVPAERTGALPSQLFHMAQHNLGALLGPEVREQLAPMQAILLALDAAVRPTATDNKLDAHEWQVTPDGRIWKTDALDHHLGHDLIGCQDPAWDVAGACVELALDAGERELLLGALFDQARLRFTSGQLAFYELAYLAFRAGHAALAAQSLAACEPAEARRMEAARERYLRLAQARLALHPG